MLNEEQLDRFWTDGYLVVENGVLENQLAALNRQLEAWIEESRRQISNFGETIDGKARFDLEPGHTPERPRLRRVANPADISETYRDALWTAPLVDMVVDLIGANVKFHHCKLNMKLPGMETSVGYHQDHPYDPHTNDDVIVALAMLTDMTRENGCLMVVPGSHRERYSLFQNDKYVGEISPAEVGRLERRAVPLTGKAGSVILQHTWMVHGSGTNQTDRPRNLLICDYTAADAFPLTPPAVPSSLTGSMVHGQPTRFARLKAGILELPAPYRQDSFFDLQGAKKQAAAE